MRIPFIGLVKWYQKLLNSCLCQIGCHLLVKIHEGKVTWKSDDGKSERISYGQVWQCRLCPKSEFVPISPKEELNANKA